MSKFEQKEYIPQLRFGYKSHSRDVCFARLWGEGGWGLGMGLGLGMRQKLGHVTHSKGALFRNVDRISLPEQLNGQQLDREKVYGPFHKNSTNETNLLTLSATLFPVRLLWFSSVYRNYILIFNKSSKCVNQSINQSISIWGHQTGHRTITREVV